MAAPINVYRIPVFRKHADGTICGGVIPNLTSPSNPSRSTRIIPSKVTPALRHPDATHGLLLGTAIATHKRFTRNTYCCSWSGLELTIPPCAPLSSPSDMYRTGCTTSVPRPSATSATGWRQPFRVAAEPWGLADVAYVGQEPCHNVGGCSQKTPACMRFANATGCSQRVSPSVKVADGRGGSENQSIDAGWYLSRVCNSYSSVVVNKETASDLRCGGA